MIVFGDRSQAEINTLDPRLIDVLGKTARFIPEELDFTVIKGFRSEDDQNKAFYSVPQRTKKKWPHSKHNMKLDCQTGRLVTATDGKGVIAFDFIPYPFKSPDDWKDKPRFAGIARAIQIIGATLSVDIRCGCDFNRDGKSLSEWDWGHVEIA